METFFKANRCFPPKLPLGLGRIQPIPRVLAESVGRYADRRPEVPPHPAANFFDDLGDGVMIRAGKVIGADFFMLQREH